MHVFMSEIHVVRTNEHLDAPAEEQPGRELITRHQDLQTLELLSIDPMSICTSSPVDGFETMRHCLASSRPYIKQPPAADLAALNRHASSSLAPRSDSPTERAQLDCKRQPPGNKTFSRDTGPPELGTDFEFFSCGKQVFIFLSKRMHQVGICKRLIPWFLQGILFSLGRELSLKGETALSPHQQVYGNNPESWPRSESIDVDLPPEAQRPIRPTGPVFMCPDQVSQEDRGPPRDARVPGIENDGSGESSQVLEAEAAAGGTSCLPGAAAFRCDDHEGSAALQWERVLQG